MKKECVVLFLLVTSVHADEKIYDENRKAVGKIDDKGFIYIKPYGGKKIGRVEDGFVYDQAYGGKRVGRINGRGFMYDKAFGGKKVGRWEKGKVYNAPYGGKRIGHTDRKDGAGYFILDKGR